MQLRDFPTLFPAPMEGVMRREVLLAAAELRLTSVWLTPFFRVVPGCVTRAGIRRFAEPFIQTQLPFYLQFMGSDAGLLSQAALLGMELGAAGINLNFACPSGTVMRHRSGGALLKTPKKILELTAAVAATKVPLSVKLRGGFDRFDCSWYGELNALKLQAVFLHFRTVKELYAPLDFGVALERFAAAAEKLPATCLIANGDLNTVERMAKAINAGATGAMSGRGWFADPGLLVSAAGMVPPPATYLKIEWLARIVELAKSDGKSGFNKGSAIELSRLMFGENNPVFEYLKNENDGAWKNLTDEFLSLKLQN